MFTEGDNSYVGKVTEGSSFYEMTSVITTSEHIKIPWACMSRHMLDIYIYYSQSILVRLENKTVIRFIFENCQVQ